MGYSLTEWTNSFGKIKKLKGGIPMLNYLIELAIVHVALYVGYWLFLRNEQQYTRMRSYLLASTVLALAIPLLKLPRLFSISQDPVVLLPSAGIPKEAMFNDAVSSVPAAAESAWGYDFFIWMYITVSSLFLLKLFSSIAHLIWLERKSRRQIVTGMTIRTVGNIKGSFSFFNWIFVSDEIDPRQPDCEVILKHEQAHASLRHTYDLIVFELFKACFWWLPTAWIVLKETKRIHEFQADAVAISTCDVDRYSSILIRSALNTNGPAHRQASLPAEQSHTHRQAGLTSSFQDSLIFKRLEAMRQQPKNVSPWKLAALTVLCASLVMAFACSEEKSVDKGRAYPEFEGGITAFNAHLMKEIRYPLQARKAGVEGRVDVQFVVEKDGTISHVEAMRRIGAGCDEEAVRVVKSLPPFKPATQNGKPARVRMVVPIVFQLNADDTNSDNSAQGRVIIEEIQSSNYDLTVEANYANGEWTGTIYDQWWEELPGANIIVPGTTRGTTSADDGTFKLKADEGNSIVVSFVGYRTVAIVTNLMGPSPKNWPNVEKVMDASRADISPYREHQHWPRD